MSIEMAQHAAVAQQAPPILLGREHVDELAPAGDELARGPGPEASGTGRGYGANGISKPRDDLRVQPVGLRELAQRRGL